MERTPAALEAQKAEWDRLWKKKVWDASTVAEWSDVAAEARHAGEEIHMGRLFGLCVEKNSELPPADLRRKFKYRVVFSRK